MDPGHSRVQPGATSCRGVSEYQFNDEMVGYLERSLEQSSSFRVTHTRAPRSEATLLERANLSSGKNLLLSIHHDSVQPQFMAGATHCSSKASGFGIFVSRLNSDFAGSLKFAKKLGEQMVASGLNPSLHHAEPIAGENRVLLDARLGIYAYDNLVVLRDAKSPALLLECGVIANPLDEERVRSAEFKGKILGAVRSLSHDANSELR